MKGLPGRAGIGIGHRPENNSYMWVKDTDLGVLRQWIGEDIGLYPNLDALQPHSAVAST
jgi:hypothetical protein